MRVYFTVSFRNRGLLEKEIQTVTKTVTSLGHKINEIKSVEQFDESPGHHHFIKLIRTSDVIITEASHQSSGIGYEVALAISEKKPVLVLVHKDKKQQLPSYFNDNASKLLTVRTYSSAEDIKAGIKVFFSTAKELLGTKFNFLLTPELDNYLEWNNKNRKIAKSEIARTAMEELMYGDEEYQDYLTENKLK